MLKLLTRDDTQIIVDQAPLTNQTAYKIMRLERTNEDGTTTELTVNLSEYDVEHLQHMLRV